MATKATWYVSLDSECPKCGEDIDLLGFGDFWDGRKIQIGEHNTPATKDMEVVCPKCGHEFTVDCEW